MRIAAIETILIGEPAERPDDEWVTTPMDVFLERGERRTSGLPRPQRGSVSNVIVRLRTDDGLEGYGTVGVGSPAAKPVIDHHLAHHVLGASPFDVELVWERMFRSTINIGRKGLVLEAMSAIDIAMWDLMGKAVGQPVYNLLGGRVRPRIRAYVSQNYARADLGVVRAEAEGYVRDGFTALKMRFGYGPSDGEAGKRKNHELVGTVREAIGPDADLMADAYMGWDVPYAIDMIRRLEEFNLRWVEEPLVPDDLDGYARIRANVSTPISGGEHEATRWGYRDMLLKGAVDIVQPDVNRMGGITEARKVWALASCFNVQVIPHSNQAHNAHLIAAHLNSPLIEYFPRGALRTSYVFYSELFDGEPECVGGWVELSDRPGLGITLNEDAVAEWRVSEDAVPA
jgi:L-alanine-DL-glutamate epimerase-like enolase superfamily enzyme